MTVWINDKNKVIEVVHTGPDLRLNVQSRSKVTEGKRTVVFYFSSNVKTLAKTKLIPNETSD